MNHPKNIYYDTQILEIDIEFSLQDICQALGVDENVVWLWIDEGIIKPAKVEDKNWHFSGKSVSRARRALNLQRDLGVNIAGAALALELLDELDELKRRLY